MKRNRKGFTLVELVIVIAVIAILAAVLIPTFSNVINDAKVSADSADAKTMSDKLRVYMAKDGIVYTEAEEVIDYLSLQGYSLETRSKTHSYWYDRETQSIILAENADVFGVDKISAGLIFGDYAYAAETSGWENDRLEALSEKYPSYLYIDQSESSIRECIDIINDLPGECGSASGDGDNVTQYVSVVSAMRSRYDDAAKGIRDELGLDSEGSSTITTMLSTYNPNYCLYVNNNAQYTSSILNAEGTELTAGATTVQVRSMRFIKPATGTLVIPKTTHFANMQIVVGVDENGGGTIEIPNYVTSISEGALTNLHMNTTVEFQSEALYEQAIASSGCINLACGLKTATSTFTYTVLPLAYSYNQIEERQHTTFSQYERSTNSGLASLADYAFAVNVKSVYLIPSLTLESTSGSVATMLDKLGAKENLGENDTGFDYIEISSADYGTVSIIRGAFTIDNTVFRFRDIGFFKSISVYRVDESAESKFIFVNDPTCGFALENLRGISIRLYLNSTEVVTLAQGDDGRYFANYTDCDEVRIFDSAGTLIFRQLVDFE